MLRIGLTGGIGSGKTTVAGVFAALGVPVYDADAAAKKLMAEDPGIRDRIIAAFGKGAYEHRTLNRKYLAQKVFGSKENIELLNSIVHPATIANAVSWMAAQQSPYVIKEAALIFEAGSQKDLDFVIGVQAPLDVRVARTMDRDHATYEQVLSRMDKQMDDEQKMRLCHYVIINDEQQMVIPQVLSLHAHLLKKAAEKK
jgi:dephospho-CoA kinase